MKLFCMCQIFYSGFQHIILLRKRKGLVSIIGITKIEKEGAEIAINLFRSLVNLFSLGPEKIELTGSFQWTV